MSARVFTTAATTAGALAVLLVAGCSAAAADGHKHHHRKHGDSSDAPSASGSPADPAAGGAGPIDLKGWKLQLPVDSDGKPSGSPAEHNPAAPVSPWMAKNSDGSLTFWAPVNGATTPHSEHTRSELVSLNGFTAGKGSHTLSETLSVAQVPPQSKDIMIGQIHGNGKIKSVPFVMLHYTDGKIRVMVKDKQSGKGGEEKVLLKGVPLNARFDYTITDAGNGTMNFTATYNGTTGKASVQIPDAFKDADVRFQVGDYGQDKAGSGSGDKDGGKLTMYTMSGH